MRKDVAYLSRALGKGRAWNNAWSAARITFGALLFGLLVNVGHASETVTYTYDALGRLVATSHSGGVNNGLQTGVSYDPAGNRSNYTVSGSPPPAMLSISNASVTEGGSLVFTVTKTGTGAPSASWASANGSASAGSDYTAANGTVSFTAGETSKTITIATTNDAAVESAETLTLTLSNPSGATIGTATGTGTINDNDVAPPPNMPPVAINDTGAISGCGYADFDVLANDYDPDGDTPLILVSQSMLTLGYTREKLDSRHQGVLERP